MSLLLQALKKSEDERAQRRNGLPLHAGRAANAGNGARSNAPLWAALVFGGIAAGLTAWVFMGGKAAGPSANSAGSVSSAAISTPIPSTTSSTIPATISSAPVAPAAIAPSVELAAAPISAPTPTPTPTPAPAPALPQATQVPTPAEAATPKRSLFIDPPAAAPATSAAPVTPPAAPAAKPAAPVANKPAAAKQYTPTTSPMIADNNSAKTNDSATSIKKIVPSTDVISFNDLPPELRAELPALRPTGYMHADDASERLIAINDRLVRVGDEVAPGLRVQALTPTAVVFSYKGYRFRVTP